VRRTTTLDVLPRFEVCDGDPTALAFVVLHDVCPGFWLFGFCELLLAPNSNRFPPVTVFLGIRSSNLMQEAVLAPVPLAPEVLPTVFCLWDTPAL
jgi:hypothetical protein